MFEHMHKGPLELGRNTNYKQELRVAYDKITKIYTRIHHQKKRAYFRSHGLGAPSLYDKECDGYKKFMDGYKESETALRLHRIAELLSREIAKL